MIPPGPARAAGRRRWPILVAVPILAGCLPQSAPPTRADASPAAAVLTQKGDPGRSGWYSRETYLTVTNVTASEFGKVADLAVDGQVYAQPLFVPGIEVGGRRYDLAVVATEHDSVYAFDAHARGAQPSLIWRRSLLKAGARPLAVGKDLTCNAISPEVGITSTPVVDLASQRLFVVAATRESSGFIYRMYALDLRTGRDALSPALLAGSTPGSGPGSSGGLVTFDPTIEQQRMSLLLLGGIVYVGFASYCDRYPFYGWLLGYRASDLGAALAYNSAPDSGSAGLWESGSGPVADGRGDLLLMTGNGTFDLASGGREAGNSLLELVPSGQTLAVVDYFSPFDQACLNDHDQDLGSAGPLLVPDQGEVVVVGKEGRVDVLRVDQLGGFRTVPNPCQSRSRTDVDAAVQELPPDAIEGGVFGSLSYAKVGGMDYIYAAGVADHLRAWRMDGGDLVPAGNASLAQVYPGAVPVVSSRGEARGTAVAWVLDQEQGPALRAYDATNLRHEIFSSRAQGGRDTLDGHVKFSVPTVADGMVLVGTDRHLVVFGRLAGR